MSSNYCSAALSVIHSTSDVDTVAIVREFLSNHHVLRIGYSFNLNVSKSVKYPTFFLSFIIVLKLYSFIDAQ